MTLHEKIDALTGNVTAGSKCTVIISLSGGSCSKTYSDNVSSASISGQLILSVNIAAGTVTITSNTVKSNLSLICKSGSSSQVTLNASGSASASASIQ